MGFNKLNLNSIDMIVRDNMFFDCTKEISIENFKYHELTLKVKREYEFASDFKIECDCGYYNENHYHTL